MKIVSPFKDYYDGIQGLGIDKSILYIRKTVEILYENTDDIGEKPKGIPVFYSVMRPSTNASLNYFVEPVTVGFCGKVYLLFGVYEQRFSGAEKLHFFTTVEKAQKAAIEFETPANRKKALAEYFEGGGGKGLAIDVKEWLDKYHLIGDKPFITLNTPIFLTRFEGYTRVLEVSPRLKPFSFAKHVNPYAAYQEIAQYITGPLAKEISPPQIIDDVVLAEGKGFNKYSFRMDSPGKKKRRRNK